MKLNLTNLDAMSRRTDGASAWYAGSVFGRLAMKTEARADRMVRRIAEPTDRQVRACKALLAAARVLRSLHDPDVYRLLGRAEKTHTVLVADSISAVLA